MNDGLKEYIDIVCDPAIALSDQPPPHMPCLVQKHIVRAVTGAQRVQPRPRELHEARAETERYADECQQHPALALRDELKEQAAAAGRGARQLNFCE